MQQEHSFGQLHEPLSARDVSREEPDASLDGPDSQERKLDWRWAHAKLSKLATCRARLDWDEGRSLLDALRSGAHLHLGFGSFGEYVERLLGYCRRSTEERLRVAEALERLPALGQALRDGKCNWSVARELTRVATRENERAWLEVARGRTVRQIEELVAGRNPGDEPEDEPETSMRRHVLRFDAQQRRSPRFVKR